MANVTATSAQYFIPQIWANTALQTLRNNIVLAKLITMDSDLSKDFTQGSALKIPFPGALVANQKTAGNAVTLQVPTDAQVTVTLNKHKETSFLVEDFARAQQNQDIMERYGNESVRALAEVIESDLFAQYINFQSIGTAGTAINHGTSLLAKKVLTDNRVPLDGRFAVISTKDELALLSDSSLQNYFAYNQGKVENGALVHLDGFDYYVSQLVPVVNGTPSTTYNIFGQKEMMVLAMRGLPDPPPGSGAVSHTVKDPVSGIILRCTMAYNPSYLGVQVTYDVLYGISALRSTCGLNVLS